MVGITIVDTVLVMGMDQGLAPDMATVVAIIHITDRVVGFLGVDLL